MGLAEFPAGGGVQLALDGELDGATSPLLAAALDRVDASRRITIDFSRCSFIDAGGIRMLIRAASSPRRTRHRVRIVGLCGQPGQVFETSLAAIERFELEHLPEP